MCITSVFYKLFKLFSPSKHLCFNTPYLPFECHMPYLTTMAAASHPAPQQSGNSERRNGGIEIILTDLGNWWSYCRRIGVPWCFSAHCAEETKMTSKFFWGGIFLCYQLTVYPTYILLLLSTCSFSSFLFENPPSTTHRKSAWRVTTWVPGPKIRKLGTIRSCKNGLPVFWTTKSL